jgi:ring-1,2-phenylacetyl-CoA epoxidase subunit PaaE
VHVERFVTGPRPAVGAALERPSGVRPVTLRVKGRTYEGVALAGATLLEAGLAAGAPLAFSCAVGGCGACRVRVASGEVEMDEPNCLEQAERDRGYVLACVGRPRGACVIEAEDHG